MVSRLTVSALPPSKGVNCLSPTVVPAVGGVLVVQVRPLSVAVSFREKASGPDVATVELSIAQWSLLVEDADVGILATRLGLLPSPVGSQ